MKGNDRIMSKKARQPRQLRALRSWLGLPQETQEENDYDDYDDFFEEFNSYEDRKSIISDNDEYDYDSNYDYASNTEDAEDTENAEYFVENPEDNFEDDLDNDLDDDLDTEQLTFGSYAEESRARIARKFTVGSCYQVVTSQNIIKRLRAGGKYVLQPMTTSGNNPEVGYTFRYLGKQGIHHMFREICGGWGRTYTDAQLVGKEVVEVSENEVRAVNRSLRRAVIKF